MNKVLEKSASYIKVIRERLIYYITIHHSGTIYGHRFIKRLCKMTFHKMYSHKSVKRYDRLRGKWC